MANRVGYTVMSTTLDTNADKLLSLLLNDEGVCVDMLFEQLCTLFISLQGAKLPMSIIIVGVGQAEFDGIVTFVTATWDK